MTDEPTPNAGEPPSPSPSSWSLDDEAMRRLLLALFHVGSDAPSTEADEEPATTDDQGQPFGASGAELAATPPRELGEGERLGWFRLERELGRGGFGVVYLAFDERLGRWVALKTPRPDRVQNAALWKRFAREARLAAALDNSAIVPVLEAGVVEGVAYIASMYQEGRSLSQWIARAPRGFPPRLAATIAAQLAEGLTHAHFRGVRHRDLKPGNIIMIGAPPSAADGFPAEKEVQARITDFGLGSFDKGDGGATLTGLWMGSPPYMAPEQALAGDQPIDARTDVYALGAILYEMLTGQSIYPRRDLADLAIRLSRGEAPPRPRQLRRGIPRDLETICLKCLAHEPSKRYASAAALWDDLRRQLDGRPIAARRTTAPERLARWAKRNPSLAALAGVLILGAVVGQTLMIRHNAELSASNVRLETLNHRLETLNQRLQTAIDDGRRQEELLAREIHASDLAAAHAELNAGDAETAQWILSRYFPEPGEPDRRGFVWRYLWGLATREYSVHDLTGPTWSRFGEPTTFDPNWWRHPFPYAWRHNAAGLRLDPAGPRLVNVSWSSLAAPDGPLKIWGLSQREIWDEPPPGGETRLTLSPDGQTLALVDSAWRLDPAKGPPPLDRRTRAPGSGPPREVVRLPACDRVGFSVDGRTLAALMILPDDQACVPAVYDLASGRGVAFDRLLRRREFIGTPAHMKEYRLPVRLAVSPDGRRLAVSLGDDSPLQVVDARDGRVIWSVKAEAPENDRVIVALAFSPSGARLVSGDVAGRTRLWDAETGRAIASAPFVSDRVEAVGFYPDEDTVVAVAHRESRVRAWPILPRGEEIVVFDHHGAEVWGIAFIAGSDLLATGGDDHLVELWDVAKGTRVATLRAHETMVTSLSAAPDGRLLASGDLDGRVWLWNPFSPEKPVRALPDYPARIREIAWSPDGRLLAIVGAAPLARIWNRETGRMSEFAIPHDNDAYAVAWSPDGATMAIGGHDERISLWRASRETPMVVLDAGQRITRLAFSPDGATLVAGNNAGGLQSWRLGRLDDPPLMIKRNSQVGGIWALAFSPDGRVLAAGDDGGNIAFWDPGTLREVCRIRARQSSKVHALAFSPNGRMLATADFAGEILVHSGAEMVDAR